MSLNRIFIDQYSDTNIKRVSVLLDIKIAVKWESCDISELTYRIVTRLKTSRLHTYLSIHFKIVFTFKKRHLHNIAVSVSIPRDV